MASILQAPSARTGHVVSSIYWLTGQYGQRTLVRAEAGRRGRGRRAVQGLTECKRRAACRDFPVSNRQLQVFAWKSSDCGYFLPQFGRKFPFCPILKASHRAGCEHGCNVQVIFVFLCVVYPINPLCSRTYMLYPSHPGCFLLLTDDNWVLATLCGNSSHSGCRKSPKTAPVCAKTC